MCAPLARFFRQHFTLLQTGAMMTAIAELALMVLENDRQARMLVSSTGSVFWTNAKCVNLLSRSSAIAVIDNQLLTQRPNMQTALDAFIADRSGGGACWCVKEDGESHLILRRQGFTYGDKQIYALTVTHTGEAFDGTYLGLQDAFGLTRAEYRVLCSLMAGHDAETVASESDLSVQTIRSHIKALYYKMSVKSREALFRRAVPFLC